MSKPLLGVVLGSVLGAIDGLTALFYPEVADQIMSIVLWSSLKSMIAGIAIGMFARKVHSLPGGIIFGFAMGLLFAFLVALGGDESGNHYYAEIMVPGSVVGIILGFATQKYGRPVTQQPARQAV